MNLGTVCRCCHSEGIFEMLNVKDLILNITYGRILEETFNIILYKNNQENSSMICNTCKIALHDAYLFKKQVLFCEEKFKLYYQNEVATKTNPISIKFEEELDSDDFRFNTGFKDDATLKLESQNQEHIKCEDTKEIPNCNMKLSEMEMNIRENMINLSENVQQNRSSMKKDIENKRVFKKRLDNKAQKRVKKKVIKREKISPLISRQYIDESLINTIQTESGLNYSCIQCGDRTFKNKVSILSHLTNYHTGAHKCPKCDRLCLNGYDLRAHYKTHFQKTFKCNICNVTCNSRYHLNEHSKKHSNSNRHKCDLCCKEFKYKNSLKIHMFVHSGGKPKHLCDICGMSFNDSTNLRIHKRSVHLKLRPFACDDCKATYTAKKHLKSHIITKHLDLKEFRCNICGRMFGSINACVKHEAVHNKVFVCCDIEFQSKGEYLSHLKKLNCKINHSKSRKNKYINSKSCEICGKVFASKFTWKRHMSQRHNDDRTRNVPCDICHQNFFDSYSVYRHKFKRHIPNIIQDKTKCNMCHKSYKNLEKHMLSHLNTPYNCNVCGKRFSEVSTRNHHLKYVHSGQRFVCNICNRGYKEKGALRRHSLRAHDVKDLNDFGDYMSSYIINKGEYQ